MYRSSDNLKTASKEAGEELAHILSQRIHGKRPVSLIGCSSGALVIWHCLRELSRKGDIGRGIISGRFFWGKNG